VKEKRKRGGVEEEGGLGGSRGDWDGGRDGGERREEMVERTGGGEGRGLVRKEKGSWKRERKRGSGRAKESVVWGVGRRGKRSKVGGEDVVGGEKGDKDKRRVEWAGGEKEGGDGKWD